MSSTLDKVKKSQGWPLSLVKTRGEIGGYKLDTTEQALLEKLSSEGVIKPPTINFADKKESFVFTPRPGNGRLNAANREIYERAMALVSTVRKGQLLPDRYRIRNPYALLRSLRDTGYLRSNSEAASQYQNLVMLRVGTLRPTSSSRSEFHLIKTPENQAALDLALQLLNSGSLANMEVDQNARIALTKGEEYVQSLISARDLKQRQKQVLDEHAKHEFEQLIMQWD